MSDLSTATAKMQYGLLGFTQNTGIRSFLFERTASDRTRTEFTVQADIILARKYGILIQELPILCRKFLEQQDSLELPCSLTFTEQEMNLHAKGCADARLAATHKKKWVYRPRPIRPAPISPFQAAAGK